MSLLVAALFEGAPGQWLCPFCKKEEGGLKAFQISWVTGFAVLMLFVAGCGEEQAEQGAEAPEDTTEQVVDEVDIYAEAPLIRVGYVGHDHHSAVYVSALRGERMAELYGIYLVPLREGELYALVEDGV